MEKKDSAISGPYEEFRIAICGKIPSGFVEWYFIDVSVEEACLSEKTESSTRELTPFSVARHLPSYAALGGHIYSLGGQRRSDSGGDTLLNDVWLLDFKSLEDLKPGPLLSVSTSLLLRDKLKLAPGWKPGSGEAPDSDKAQVQAQAQAPWTTGCWTTESDEFCDNDWDLEEPKPEPKKAHRGEYPEAQAYFKTSEDWYSPTEEVFGGTDSDDENWKPGLPMNFSRCNPHTMVVDHKLYVLGGFLPNQNQADGWIEVFDPEEKKWESLPSPPDQIHSSIMISGLLKSKKEIIIAKQRWDCHPLLFYSYNITTRCWDTLVPPESELSVHSESKASVHSNVERAVILPPNIGRAVTVGNTLYWISSEEHKQGCTIRAYDFDRKMWFEDHLNTATIFGRLEYFSSIYSRGPGFLHLVEQKFCLLLQSTITKKDPQSSIEYLYCVILDISPIYEHEHEDWGKFELTTVSVQKYSMDHYIDFLDCMLL